MSSFPEVVTTTLSLRPTSENTWSEATWTVPSQYAFAVVQVCFLDANKQSSYDVVYVSTSHGDYNFVRGKKDLPVLNIIIKGGESFSLKDVTTQISGTNTQNIVTVKLTALCHRTPA